MKTPSLHPGHDQASLSGPDKRLAIIGGGMGGTATAWLCDAAYRVSLFEAKDGLGGNCDTETVLDRDRPVFADLGAQFFHPETHPTYIALLQHLELLSPAASSSSPAVGRNRLEIPAHLAVLPLEGGAPRFISTHVMRTPLHAIDFAVYSRAARKMAFCGDYAVTMESWVDALNVSRPFKDRILLPWLTASEGHPLEETKRSSARAILQLFAPSHPKNLLEKATTWCARGGFQATVQALAAQCKHAVFHTRRPVVEVEKIADSWYVGDGDSRSGPFDAVVINAPPWESKKLLERLPWSKELLAVLDRFEFRTHRLTLHTDPIYMHRERRNWALANVGVESTGAVSGGDATSRGGESSELSIWLGATRPTPSERPVDVFKSWTTYRRQYPKHVLAERTFQHSIKTPDMMQASADLGRWQGKEGLWFAGQFTSGIDLQESALRSAMEVGRALAPASRNLLALEGRRPSGRHRVESSILTAPLRWLL